jgi:hypothetical protein
MKRMIMEVTTFMVEMEMIGSLDQEMTISYTDREATTK